MHLTIAITDIHGCLSELLDLQKEVREYAARRGADLTWAFLGDYIDRGPDSAGVLKHLRDFQQRHERVHVLCGNHDAMMSAALLDQDDGRTWSLNGLETTFGSYGHEMVSGPKRAHQVNFFNSIAVLKADKVALDDARWLANLPLSHEDTLRYFVHAGIRPGIPLAGQTHHDQLWIRTDFLRDRRTHPKHVVHGHTPAPEGLPERRGNRTGLDTACASTGVLTAGIFNDEQAEPIGFLSTGDGGLGTIDGTLEDTSRTGASRADCWET